MNHEPDQVVIDAAVMQRLLTAIYARAGCSDEEAAHVAANLVGANLRGHDSHGVIRTPRYVDRVLAFYQGEVICDAPPAEALLDPKVIEFVIGTDYQSVGARPEAANA